MRGSPMDRTAYLTCLEMRVWLWTGLAAAAVVVALFYIWDQPGGNYSGFNASLAELHETGRLPGALGDFAAAVPSMRGEAAVVWSEAIDPVSMVLWVCPLFAFLGPLSGGISPGPYLIANNLALPISRTRLLTTRFTAMCITTLAIAGGATTPTLVRAAWGHYPIPWGPLLLSTLVAWFARVPFLAGAEALSYAAESRRVLGVVVGLLAIPYGAVNIWLNFAVGEVLISSKELLWITAGAAVATAVLLAAAVRIAHNREF